MEFKSRKGEDNTSGNSRINRNIMEFKSERRERTGRRTRELIET